MCYASYTHKGHLDCVRKKRKSNADCSEQYSSTASEPNIKEKRSRRSDHDPTTIENCFCVRKQKLYLKMAEHLGIAELQSFEASKTLIDTGEICNNARALLAIKDQDSRSIVNSQHQSCIGPMKIPTLAKWLISPSICVIIEICKKYLVLKTNSNIYIYSET